MNLEALEALDSDDISDDEKDFDVPEESKISKTLSDKTTRTVVILVLILLFLLALCSIDSYTETDIMHSSALKDLVVVYNLKDQWDPAYKVAHERLITSTRSNSTEYPLIFLEAPDPTGNYTTKLKTYDWKDAGPNDFFGYIDYTLLRKEEFTAI